MGRGDQNPNVCPRRGFFRARALFELWARFQMFWRARGGDFIKEPLSEIEIETANNIEGTVA